ncbi:hypothetical protein NQ317_007340 [Molorchus minor]|uniref:Lipase maturation factor n=1 Tax=Molorchus minor TaxID=1323400 RepID=A0ABQ9IYY8_9CUCU|nr:hypothetical protein NQ317_007340 [Molorchus minor]
MVPVQIFSNDRLTKFISGCPKWWDLTALYYHFETMPLPTPLSWYSYYLPPWSLRLVQIYANVCEVVFPFLFFVPIRSVRITNFVFQLLLQICIVLTGNFDFSNVLIVTLLLSLLDDQFFYGRKKSISKWSIVGKIISVVLYGIILYGVIVFCRLEIKRSQIISEFAFTKSEFNDIVSQILTYSVHFGLLSLAGTVLYALSNVIFDNQGSGNKVLNVASTVFYTIIAALLFFSNTVPLVSLNSTSNSTVNPSVRTVYNRLHKLHAVNQYGLFSKMAGVDGRLEIILEASDNAEGPWREYNFLYKPGNVNHSLPFVAPYAPKLDWQISKATWWTRERVAEYFPPYSKDNSALLDYLKARNLLPTLSNQFVNPIWKQILDGIRYITNHLEATLLFWSVLTAGLALICTSSGSSKK